MLLSADDMAAIDATERGRVGGVVAHLRGAAERVSEARTALRSLAGRIGAQRAWKGAGDSLRTLAGTLAR